MVLNREGIANSLCITHCRFWSGKLIRVTGTNLSINLRTVSAMIFWFDVFETSNIILRSSIGEHDAARNLLREALYYVRFCPPSYISLRVITTFCGSKWGECVTSRILYGFLERYFGWFLKKVVTFGKLLWNCWNPNASALYSEIMTYDEILPNPNNFTAKFLVYGTPRIHFCLPNSIQMHCCWDHIL